MNRTVEKGASGLKKVFGKLADPVLIYAVISLTAIMYHFYDKLAVQYCAASLVLGFLLFRLFDFMNIHRLIGGFCYIMTWGLTFAAVQNCINIGYRDFDMSFALWFFTPQSAMDYNQWYSNAVFLLFGVFMCSVIYYFTRIRYRLFMNFLVFIIPFLIYGKEYEKMPTHFIILLAAGFIVLLFYCRQLGGDKKTIIVDRKGIISSAAVFTLIFTVAAAVIPKPEIKEDRTGIETMFSADSFTDKLVAMLTGYRDTTEGSQFRRINSEVLMYLAKSDEPLRLKTATFSNYRYINDSWTADKPDSAYTENYKELPIELPLTGELTEALMYVARNDSEFAEAYGLTEFLDKELYSPERKEMTVISVYQPSKSAPVPQFVEKLISSSSDDEISGTLTGLLFNRGESFRRTEKFTFEYCTDKYFASEVNYSFINRLGESDYYEMLKNAKLIALQLYSESRNSADEESCRYHEILEREFENYKEYVRSLTDYGDSEKILELAEDITEGLSSDYEKARAIEAYFYLNNYVYDLNYVKSAAENVENFLFYTKRGVCYEYATSMVLLARAVGIPARYCEGFNMSQQSENEKYGTNYRITTMDSHGYPELYIKGFGWMSFEPTVTDSVAAVEERDSALLPLARAGIMLLGAGVLVLAFILVYPLLRHRFFLILSRKRSPDKTASAAMHMICSIYGITAVNTSEEVAAIVRKSSGADISELVRLFDKSVYGGIELTEAEKDIIIRDYVNAYNSLREKKKEKKPKHPNAA